MTIPRHWNKFVDTIWNPMTGKAIFMILSPLFAMVLSSGSLVNTLTASDGHNSPTRNPTIITRVASFAVRRNTSFTRLYFLAPKLYPAIGCIP